MEGQFYKNPDFQKAENEATIKGTVQEIDIFWRSNRTF
jgi:hypothetical protein